jgi:hypothetical protein
VAIEKGADVEPGPIVVGRRRLGIARLTSAAMAGMLIVSMGVGGDPAGLIR